MKLTTIRQIRWLNMHWILCCCVSSVFQQHSKTADEAAVNCSPIHTTLHGTKKSSICVWRAYIRIGVNSMMWYWMLVRVLVPQLHFHCDTYFIFCIQHTMLCCLVVSTCILTHSQCYSFGTFPHWVHRQCGWILATVAEKEYNSYSLVIIFSLIDDCQMLFLWRFINLPNFFDEFFKLVETQRILLHEISIKSIQSLLIRWAS